MFQRKSLRCLSSLKAFWQCYGIIEKFTFCYGRYYLCERFRGCIRRHIARKDYCCVCVFHKHYSHRELDFVKHDGLKLQKFYFNILKDLAEIVCVNPTVVFWENEYFYCKYTQKFRTRHTSMRKNLEYYFLSQMEVLIFLNVVLA